MMGKFRWLLILLSLVVIWGKAPIMAAELNSLLRLERMKTLESLQPVLVRLNTNSLVIESNVEMVVGAAWTVDSGNVAITTTGLPGGVTPLPGLVGVVSTIGNTIRISCGDLTAGTNYGFYVTRGIGVNPIVGAGTNYKWKIRTVAGGVIDSEKEITIPIVADDQIVVTGRVGAKASDFQLEMVATPNTTVNQGQQINLVITYGNLMQSPARPLKISGQWFRGTTGSGNPPVDVVDYVVGSASNGYNGVAPVVDLVNKTITWTVTSIPASLQNQTVSFSLKTNNNYTGAGEVNFKVSAILEGSNVLTKSKDVNLTYKYLLVPTSTPTPVPTANPTSSSSSGNTVTTAPRPTATPISVPRSLTVKSLEVVGLNGNKMEVGLVNNQVADRVTVKYGTSIGDLGQKITSLTQALDQQIKIDQLAPGTDYFFQVEIKKGNETVTSEVYTFKTPSVVSQTEVDPKSVFVSSTDNVILDANSTKGSDSNKTIIPIDKPYVLKVNINKPELIKRAYLVVKNSQILGITSVNAAEPNTLITDLTNTTDTGFVGQLASPKIPGYYQVFIRTEDIYGNINENLLVDLKVVEPMMIFDGKRGGIEGARVLVSRYDEVKKIYTLIQSQYKGLQNPIFSEPTGELPLILPKGRYKLEISALGYVDQVVYRNMDYHDDNMVHRIYLTRKGFNIGDQLSYVSSAIGDSFKYVADNLSVLTSSRRFMGLMMSVNLIFLVIIMVIHYLIYKKSNEERKIKYILSYRKLFLREFGQMFFGALLLLSLGLQIMLLLNLGLIESLTSIVFGLINLGLWTNLVLKVEVNYAKKID